MKLLIKYLTPYKGLISLTMLLAAINICFSLIDPILFGKLINLANQHQGINKPPTHNFDWNRFFTSYTWKEPGVLFVLTLSISVAMISRIAKAFQDYFQNLTTQKFGTKVFTDGLQHAMKLPYQDFEDQRNHTTGRRHYRIAPQY